MIVTIRRKINNLVNRTNKLGIEIGTENGQFLYWDGSNWAYINIGDLKYDDTNKRVGIGTDSPNAQLDNSGDTRLGDSTTNYTEIKSDGEIILHGTARVYKTVTINFAHQVVQAHGKPTSITLGTHSGFSLPIFNDDDEELYSCLSLHSDLDSTGTFTAYIGCYIDTANTDKNFKLQVSYTVADLGNNEVLDATATDVEVETDTATASQYKSFKIPFTLSGLSSGKKLGIRIRRIDASADEISGEVVICGMVLKYTSNKLGVS